MTMSIPALHVGVATLLILLSLPFIAHWVPMNAYLGFRFGKSLASEENWYVVNAFGGRCLLAYGVGLALFAALTWSIAPLPTSALAPLFIAMPFLGLAPVLVMVQWFAHEL